ncbi:MAG TPA: alpha/beta hydrolase [Nocardioidaceae bacterium]|nr:alpha/beta hydrolase [Nocardioidaceae bacterium]
MSPVDPHVAGLLQFLADSGTPPVHASSPEQARDAFRALAVGLRQPQHVVPVRRTCETTVPGGDGERPARIYRPEVDGPVPTVVLFHGGGWVIGDLDTHDNMARSICRDAAAVVVSVDYRLAPEAPFPAGLEDALAATRWAAEHLDELGGDARLAVAGDSAGGNLAAVVAQQLRDADGPELAAQFLVYPATDAPGEYASRIENGEGYFLELATMEWFIGHYAAVPATRADPRISPLRAESLRGLPPAVVVTAEYDPLRDEGEAYAAALRAAGVPTEVRRFEGMIHGFFDMGPLSPGAQEAVDASCALFGKLLHG